jgi:hypothetical protein
MKRTILAAIALAGVAGTVALPTIVSGNARRSGDGSLAAMQLAETPFIASLSGANELPNPGDPDGAGSAAVSFHEIDDGLNIQVCWDLAYSNIADPIMAHIHQGTAEEAGPVVVDFGDPPPDAHSGCVTTLAEDVAGIIADPSAFYVNVHTPAPYEGGAIRGQLAAGPAPAGATHFLPSPLRAYDSRADAAGIMAAGSTRTVSLASGVDLAGAASIAVPPGATAAIVTLTATETGGPGFLTIYSDSASQPATSNLNFTAAGSSIAVSTQVAVDQSGEIKVTAGPAATHVIVDVVGYLY